MASIIDQVIQGVIPYSQNEALQRLAAIFGEQMLGVGNGTSRLVSLSTALNPIYIGLLFIILAYIGIHGVIKTASDGKFLGQWSSVGVPGMLMLCIVLLSPVPTQNGATLGQVIFVKMLKFGSNFADFTLMKVFDAAQSEAITYNLASEHIPQVNDQMKGAFVMYMCANQLNQMGYGSRVDYFLLLTKVCGLPVDIVGRYDDKYTPGNAAQVGIMNEKLKAITADTGLKISEKMRYDSSAVVNYLSNMSPSTKQLDCHFKQFDLYFRPPVPAPVAAKAKISSIAPISAITGPNGSNEMLTQVNNTLAKYSKPHLGVMWPRALNESYRCVIKPEIIGAQEAAKEVYTTNPDTAVPWRSGWSNAALAMSDQLDSYKSAMSNSKLSLSMEAIATPDIAQLGSSLTDKQNQALIFASLKDVQEFTSGMGNTPDSAAQVLIAGILAATPEKPLDWVRVGATVILPVAIFNTRAIGNAGPPTASQAARLKTVSNFLNTLIGKTVTAIPSGLGKMSSLAGTFITSVAHKIDFYLKKEKLVETAGSGGLLNPMGTAAKIVNGVSNALLMPGPTMVMAASILLLVVNVIILLPQVVLLVVMLIWMAKAAVWYMIIPLATVLMALPNTRVGHDVWKSSLSIILTPFLALIFYIISLFIFDQMYGVVIHWVFEPIIRGFEAGFASGMFSILMQIFTSEIVFRFLAGLSLIGAVTVYMSMLILRGPDLITQTLGLKGSSGDLGDEFSGLRNRLDPIGRMRGQS